MEYYFGEVRKVAAPEIPIKDLSNILSAHEIITKKTLEIVRKI